jgi:RNA polymerase sigma factor (sigma-70 family)
MTGTNDLDVAYLRYTTNPTAIDSLLEAVRKYATRVAERNDHPSPEDAAQEIVVKTWKALSRFERRSSFRSFVHTIVMNHLYDEIRAQRARITLTPVEEMPEQQDTVPGHDKLSLDGFSEEERRMLWVFAQIMDFTKAAAMLGITPKALRSRLERLKVKKAA